MRVDVGVNVLVAVLLGVTVDVFEGTVVSVGVAVNEGIAVAVLVGVAVCVGEFVTVP